MSEFEYFRTQRVQETNADGTFHTPKLAETCAHWWMGAEDPNTADCIIITPVGSDRAPGFPGEDGAPLTEQEAKDLAQQWRTQLKEA